MTHLATGRFFAVGVGPGDPELLTLRAASLIQQADAVYHAGPASDQGRALDIVRRWLRPEQKRATVRTAAMGELSASAGKDLYRAGVAAIAADCRQGLTVVFITEGDPTVYSTAAYVWPMLAELAPEVPVEIVPGVSSITAAAARTGWPLGVRDEPFAVVPAHYHTDDLKQWLDDVPTVCLLKPASALPVLADLLGAEHEAVYVENLGTEREWLTRDLHSAIGRKEYFGLVIVKNKSWRARGAATQVPPGSPLSVVGIGPGDPGLLTLRAKEVLESAEVVVGYDGYLRQLGPLGLRAEMHGSPIGAEADRARQALNLARSGRRVVLVSSGDAGVYGMASLLLESATALPEIDIEVVPGVTAALAGSALLGAPLGHDFACISLSDLLTPWERIEQRLDAAARGDFVIALYNPISQKRNWQLGRAREIVLRHRRPETPVGLVDRAYREGCKVWKTTLGSLSVDGIGMETILIIGNSQTRIVNGRMVTPRGYSQPAGREGEAPAEPGGRGRPSVPDFPRDTKDPARQEPRPPSPDSALRAPHDIIEKSFAIIARELGPHHLPPWLFAVVRRMIHASADFEYAQTIRFSAGFEAIQTAIQAGAAIVTDTEMVRIGIASTWAGRRDVTVVCHLNDPETVELAIAAGITRSAAGIRVAARLHQEPILAIGNAPTALDEALRLVAEEGWRPAAIVGLPVGFVGVVEAKERLLAQSALPYLTCTGRKGGSAVTAAAVNALIEFFA